jgi:hypothetical protein
MSEEEKIEESREDGKSESPVEVNDELEIVKRESSDVNEETKDQTSEINTSDSHCL